MVLFILNDRKVFIRQAHTLYSDWLRTGRSGDRIPVAARFSAPVQTGLGAHPASCTMGTGSFPGVKSGQGVTLTPHPLLVPWSWKSRAIPLLPLWAVRPVPSLSACKRVHFTFTYTREKSFLNQNVCVYAFLDTFTSPPVSLKRRSVFIMFIYMLCGYGK